jgi:hypothetical protein
MRSRNGYVGNGTVDLVHGGLELGTKNSHALESILSMHLLMNGGI